MISLIMLLTSLAIKKKKKAEIQYILLFLEYYKHCPVLSARTMCLQEKGEALVWCLHSALTG